LKELSSGNFELEQPTTFLGRWTFCNLAINNQDPCLTHVTSCTAVGAGKLDAMPFREWTMLSTRSFSIETSAREMIGREKGRGWVRGTLSRISGTR
jgi:hypothetical protein